MSSADQIPDILERISQEMLVGLQTYFSSRREKSMDSARLFRDVRSCFLNIHDLVQKGEESRRRSEEIHVYAQILSDIISVEMVANIGDLVQEMKSIEGVEQLHQIITGSSEKDEKLKKIRFAAECFDKMANMFEKGFKF